MKQMIWVVAALAMAVPAAGQGVAIARSPQPMPNTENQMAEKQAVERARVMVESRITPRAPYSADTMTEAVQVLSDGNRISRKTLTRIYRDSEGRTRREQLSATGELQNVSISDPVVGVTYILNPSERVAHRSAAITMDAPAIAGVAGTLTPLRAAEGRPAVAVAGVEAGQRRKVEEEAVAAAAATALAGGGRGGRGGTVVYPAEGLRMVAPDGFAAAPGNVSKEDLGQQSVEGVLATGTRTTTTIPAGAIGNEQPIVIVSEQWFAPDLKVLVMTKHSDPRSGETTYRLSNINQAEPARSLFEVPGDYTIKESTMRLRQPQVQPEL